MDMKKIVLSGSLLCLMACFGAAHAKSNILGNLLQKQEATKTEKYKWNPEEKDDSGEMVLKYYDDGTVSITINTKYKPKRQTCELEDIKGTLKNNVIKVNQRIKLTKVKFNIKLENNKAIVDLGDNEKALTKQFCEKKAHFEGEYVKK